MTSKIKSKSKLRERRPIDENRFNVQLTLFNGTNLTLKECYEEIKKTKNRRIKKKFRDLANILEQELLA